MKIKKCLFRAAMIATLATGIVGCSKDPYRSSGRVMDDRSVRNRVKNALNDSPVYKYPHVDVTTYNGVVQLNGFVHRQEQKTTAGEMASDVEGVRQVINNISILPAEALGGTVDPKTGVRGTARNQPPTSSTTTPTTNQNRNPNQ